MRGNDSKSVNQFRALVEPINQTCDPSQAISKVYVGLEHIDSGAFRLDRHGHPNDVTSAKNRFQRNDILYGKLRPYLDKAVIAECDGICSTDILVFRAKTQVNPVFVLGQIHSAAFQAHAAATTKGVNHPRTSWNGLASFECFAPRPPEQQKIAAVLWKLQRAIATQDRLLAGTADLKQSAMQRLFTHGLYGEPLKHTEIGPMPESWQPITIGSFAKLSAGGTPSRGTPEYWNGGTIPWVKTGEVDYGVILDTEEKITPLGLANSAAKLLPKHTLLIAMYGQGITRGKVALLGIEAATNQACVAIRHNEKEVRTDFLFYALTHGYERLRGLAHGGQQQNLNADLIRSFTFACPQDTDEQRAIAAALATIDRKLAHHRAKRAALHDLFETLLHKLMTAEIRVADLDIDTSEVVGHVADADKMVAEQTARASTDPLPGVRKMTPSGKRRHR